MEITETEALYNVGWTSGFYRKSIDGEEDFKTDLAFLRGFYDGSKSRRLDEKISEQERDRDALNSEAS